MDFHLTINFFIPIDWWTAFAFSIDSYLDLPYKIPFFFNGLNSVLPYLLFYKVRSRSALFMTPTPIFSCTISDFWRLKLFIQSKSALLYTNKTNRSFASHINTYECRIMWNLFHNDRNGLLMNALAVFSIVLQWWKNYYGPVLGWLDEKMCIEANKFVCCTGFLGAPQTLPMGTPIHFPTQHPCHIWLC